MGELTIRLTDAKLLAALEQMAALSGRPVETEVEEALRNAAASHTRQVDAVRRSREIRAMTPKGAGQTDSVQIIRDMREARDRELGN